MNFPLEKRTVSKTLQLHGGQMKKETFESDEVNSLHGRILKPVVYKLGENHGKKKLAPGVIRNIFICFVFTKTKTDHFENAFARSAPI